MINKLIDAQKSVGNAILQILDEDANALLSLETAIEDLQKASNELADDFEDWNE